MKISDKMENIMCNECESKDNLKLLEFGNGNKKQSIYLCDNCIKKLINLLNEYENGTKSNNLTKFMNEIKRVNGFIEAYYIEVNDEMWIITDKYNFNDNLEYFHLLNKYYSKPVNITIWDYDTEMDEVRKNLQSYNYTVISK